MRVAILFSGGKDSSYASWMVQKEGHEIVCLVSIISKNPDSFMFHTPAIELTKRQADLMRVPLILKKSDGEKEEELKDLSFVIERAIKEFGVEGIVTGAIGSNYQADRIKKICEQFGVKCISPLWKKNQLGLLREIVAARFFVIISAVAAYPLDSGWIGRKIDEGFIEEVSKLQKKYRINPAGEGGEFESLVLDGPIFSKRLNVKLKKVVGEGHSWRGVFE
jgi:asparagine synthase (glutamine-hydrolysing)